MNRPSIGDIIDFERRLTLNRDDTYLRSYPEIVLFFKEISKLDEGKLIVGALLTYGWMPTIPTLNFDQLESIVPLFDRVRKNNELDQDDLLKIKAFINNSLVGVSKLLHFNNPRQYPIWDSRICKHVYGKAHQYIVNNVANYFEYRQLCYDLTSEPQFHWVHSSIEDKLGYSVSPYRAVELVIFEMSK